MTVAARHSMGVDEFLVWERGQELRFEFDGLQPVAMTGGSVAHSVVATNLVRALQDRHPDAVVTCSPVANEADVVPEPVVVFEVLSASTAGTDRIEKNAEYRATPSIQRYVMLEQTRAAATVFERVGDDWVGHVLVGDVVLGMPEIGVEMPLAGLYAGLAE